MNRRQREQRRQRLVTIVVGTAIGLALLAVLIGVSYDRLWIPSRPVAQVGGATLTRGGYWAERRNEIARQIVQNLQLQAMFGTQFGNQFEQQLVTLDAQVPNIRTEGVDDATVSGWVDRQLIIQNAAGEYNLQPSDGEAAQQLLGDLGRMFAPPEPAPTATGGVTPTAVIEPTAAPTSTPGGPTETATATATEAPTAVPTATPLADAALSSQDAIFGRVYDAYQQRMLQLAPDAKTNLTLEDFKAALHDQYLRQSLVAKIQEQLVPDASFTPSTEPSGIETRQILISTTATLSDTDQMRADALAARKPAAEAILAELQGGADFAELAKQKSEDYTTRGDGGALPTFDPGGKTSDGRQIDPAIVEAVKPLKENEFSGLIQTPFGWHIVQLIRREVPTKETQIQEERTKKFDEWVAQKRTATTVDRFPPVSPTPTSEPTATPGILPTVQLYATPTATAVVTATATLDGTPAATAQP